jgi:hypothetical protein
MEDDMCGACSTHERDENTKFWLESFNGRDHSKDRGVDGEIILKWILGKYSWSAWTGRVWMMKLRKKRWDGRGM